MIVFCLVNESSSLIGCPDVKSPGSLNNTNHFSSQQKFLIVMEIYTMNEAELTAYCREQGLYAK